MGKEGVTQDIETQRQKTVAQLFETASDKIGTTQQLVELGGETLGPDWKIEKIEDGNITIDTFVSDPINFPDNPDFKDGFSFSFFGVTLINKRLRKCIAAGFAGGSITDYITGNTSSIPEMSFGVSYTSSISDLSREEDTTVIEAVNAIREIGIEPDRGSSTPRLRIFPITTELILGTRARFDPNDNDVDKYSPENIYTSYRQILDTGLRIILSQHPRYNSPLGASYHPTPPYIADVLHEEFENLEDFYIYNRSTRNTKYLSIIVDAKLFLGYGKYIEARTALFQQDLTNAVAERKRKERESALVIGSPTYNPGPPPFPPPDIRIARPVDLRGLD